MVFLDSRSGACGQFHLPLTDRHAVDLLPDKLNREIQPSPLKLWVEKPFERDTGGS